MHSHRTGSFAQLIVVSLAVFAGCGMPDPGTGPQGNPSGPGPVDPPGRGLGYREPTPEQLAGLSQDADPRLDGLLDPKSGATMTAVLPAVDLTSRLPGVLDQGQMGSCAAFANTIVGSLARTRADGTARTVSAAFLYERQLALSQSSCKDGTFLHTGLETLMREGAPLEAEAPYSDAVCTTGTAAGAEGARSRIGGFNKLEPFRRDDIREALSSGVPVPFGCTIAPNFMNFSGAENYKSDDGQAGGPHGGGHAMVIVGYDDARGAYRVQNSWGSGWGDQGYVWWDYADLEGRPGLHAFIPVLLPADMAVDPTPTPGEFTLTAVGAAQFVFSGINGVAIRLQGNAPFRLLGVEIAQLSTSDVLDEQIIYGDVTLPLDGPAAPGTYELTVQGELEGAPFTLSVPFTIDEPISLD